MVRTPQSDYQRRLNPRHAFGWVKLFNMFSGMGTVCKNTNFHGIETDFLWKETIVHGEKKLAVQKEKKKRKHWF